MNMLLKEIGYSLRLFRKSPGFTMVAASILALGIGANTSVFSVVHAVLLAPLPYDDAQRLVTFSETRPQFWEGRPINGIAVENLVEWRTLSRTLEGLASYGHVTRTLSGMEEPVRITGMSVSSSFFSLLRARPFLGRTFLVEEERPSRLGVIGVVDGERVIVLSYGTWQKRYGADPDVLAKTVSLDGNRYSVVGVMPSDFYFLDKRTEYWIPSALVPPAPDSRALVAVTAIGRLKEGVGLDQAQTEGNLIARRVQEGREQSEAVTIHVTSLREHVVRNVRPALLMLQGAAGLVLLIGCANVANLLLARAAGRRKEIAIRTVLGAPRARLIREMLVESMLLALLGGVLALLSSSWGMHLFTGLIPGDVPRLDEIRLSLPVYSFTAGASFLTTLLFGLAPALQGTRGSASPLAGDRIGRQSGRWLRAFLAIAEVALAFVLLVGAGLLAKSFIGILRVDPGFDPDHVLTVRLRPPRSSYPEAEMHKTFYDDLLQAVSTLPDVHSAGITSRLPLAPGSRYLMPVDIEGQFPAAGEKPGPVEIQVVSAGFFQAMRIPLLRGRLFAEGGQVTRHTEVLINDALAKALFPTEEPISRIVRVSGVEPRCEIVGVVVDVSIEQDLHVSLRPSSLVFENFPVLLGYGRDDIASNRHRTRHRAEPTLWLSKGCRRSDLGNGLAPFGNEDRLPGELDFSQDLETGRLEFGDRHCFHGLNLL